jgi:serine/threonine-protein kinase RsbW
MAGTAVGLPEPLLYSFVSNVSDSSAQGFTWLEQPAVMGSFEALRTFVTDAGTRAGLSEDALFKLELVLEEVVVNVIQYAYADGAPGDVAVGWKHDGGEFVVQVKDAGVAFDQMAGEDPDVTQKIEERGVGGLGRFLTRQMADRLEYERRDGVNMLTFAVR